MSQTPTDDELPAVTPQKAKKAGRGFIIFGLLLVTALGVAAVPVFLEKARALEELTKQAKDAAEAPILVDVVLVRGSPASRPLTLPATVAAWYQSTIYARVDGYVAKWMADIGDSVKKGQVLAILDTPEVDAHLAAAQAKVKSDEALVERRQSDAEFAKTTYKRWSDSPKGVVSDQEREAKKAANDEAIGKLSEAKAQLGLDQAEVDQYTAFSNFKNVLAPYDGVITNRQVDIGNLVSAGSSKNTTPLYRIQQNDPVRVLVDVPQSFAPDIHGTTAAVIRVGNSTNLQFNGVVSRTAREIDPKTRTLRVEVDLPNPKHDLVPGMYVDVSFDIQALRQVQVPAGAIVFHTSGAEVGVIDEKNRIKFKPVTIANDYGAFVEISSGLSVGDKIAINLNSAISDGDLVDPHESDVHVTGIEATKKQ